MFSRLFGWILMATMLGAVLAATCPAPTARADNPVADIVAAVQGDFALGQTAFSLADTDFAASDDAGGVAALFDGIDSDLLSVPDNILQGSLAALTGVAVESSYSWSLPVVNFEDATIAATQLVLSSGSDYITVAAELAQGHIAEGLTSAVFDAEYVTVIAPEILAIGAVDSV